MSTQNTQTQSDSEAGTMGRTALVTGATGYVGGQVVERLLREGWRVRILSRDREKARDSAFADRIVKEESALQPGNVLVIEGDADDPTAMHTALQGADVAWFLLHSMGDTDDFADTEAEIAGVFARSAKQAGVGRIVYLGGLHPHGEELSEHLASRVRVGEILMASGVPTAALQAGIVIGDGSSSFSMLRHLAERLPFAIGPKWIKNRVSPIAVDDAVHYLVRAADLPANESRTFDIGAKEPMRYCDMMRRFAELTHRSLPRIVLTAPVATPRLAAHWVSLVTPVKLSLARPLIGSLVHDTVVKERDLDALVGAPEGGVQTFDRAVLKAVSTVDTSVWPRALVKTGAAVGACMAIGTVLSDPNNPWYRKQKQPQFQPPRLAFPIAWTALYTDIALTSALVLADAAAANNTKTKRSFRVALAINLALNAAWSGLFFRAHNRVAATAGAGMLAASSIDLVRRAGKSSPERGVVLAPYAGWTLFATALAGSIAWLNRGRRA